MNQNQINILHWNARGIRNKKLEFFDFLISRNILIACLNETKLNSDIGFSHNLFHVFRLDNQEGRISRGGVAIIIHKSIQCQVMSSFNTEAIQAIGVTVNLSTGHKLNIISAYFNGNRHHIGAFRRDLRKITLDHSIILSDLNSKHHY